MSGPASNNEAPPESGGGGCGWVLLVAVVLGVVGVLAYLAPPGFPLQIGPMPTASQPACITNLRQIDAAKEQWALEHKKTIGDEAPPTEVAMYLKNSQLPVCPKTGKAYDVGRVGEAPACLTPEHTLSDLAAYPASTWLLGGKNAQTPAGQRVVCGTNLRFIDAAKAYRAQQHGNKPGAVPPEEALFGPRVRIPTPRYFQIALCGMRLYERRVHRYVSITKPMCPAGGVYSIGAVGEPARCSLPEHAR